jgi:hypothetical protein
MMRAHGFTIGQMVALASPLIAITMGIVVVACLAARVPGVPCVMRHSSQ